MKGIVTNADAAEYIHCPADCPGSSPAAPSDFQATYQLRRSSVRSGAMRAAWGTGAGVANYGDALNSRCRANNWKCLD